MFKSRLLLLILSSSLIEGQAQIKENILDFNQSVKFKPVGDDKTIDAGFNWYINNDNIKLTLHYINQSGETGMNNGDYVASSFLIVF